MIISSLRVVALLLLLSCLLSTGMRADEVPWPVAGSGRVFVDVMATTSVQIYDSVGGLFGNLEGSRPGAAWHVLPAGDYSVALTGWEPVGFRVTAGGSLGLTVRPGGEVAVYSGLSDSGAVGSCTAWFWSGFSMVFTIGLLGLGTKWSGHIMGGGNRVNE